jgi:hypothetical protein
VPSSKYKGVNVGQNNIFTFLKTRVTTSLFRRGTLTIFILTILIGAYFLFFSTDAMKNQYIYNPIIAEMITEISEFEIYDTVADLQSFLTRKYGYQGNMDAGTYLFNRLDAIPGLNVEYQGGDYRNIIATLPGVDETSNTIYIVGAHYDSTSSDPNNAPGATDNGGGVATILELARVMSRYEFNHTLKFALWNAEEDGFKGSLGYADVASANDLNISLYFNYDSSVYDPYNRLILDVMYNDDSVWASYIITQHNRLYGIGFALTYNKHNCGSDHKSFQENGYAVLMTHQEKHGPAHTPEDIVEKVSTQYARKNGQLGMSLLAELAEIQDGVN